MSINVEIWTKITFQVSQMCTELNGFAQRSLYFLHFWNVLRLFWERKKRNKMGIFLGLRLGFCPPPRSLHCVHPSTACKPDPCLEAGSGCQESGSKLKTTLSLDQIFMHWKFISTSAYILLPLNPFHSQMELQWRTRGAATPVMCISPPLLNQYPPIITYVQ